MWSDNVKEDFMTQETNITPHQQQTDDERHEKT